jgi:hypothetical protein
MICDIRFARTIQFACFALLSSFVLHPSSLYAQGSLAPPGPPGATMVTLSQVEPKTPISFAPFVITNPGSYYLTTNLFVTVVNTNAITIQANNVTIDLNGFTLSGTGTGDGIQAASPFQQLMVRNGIIQDWSNGVDVAVGNGGVFNDVFFLNNAIFGLVIGTNFLVQDCQAVGNYNGIEIVGSGATLLNDNCSFNTNAGFYAVGPGSGNRLEGNLAVNNLSTGFFIGSSSNLVIWNFAHGNITNNYNIGLSNNPGPIITSSEMATNNNPYANFSF